MQLPALAAGQGGMDLGRTLATAAALKTGELQNQLLQSQIDRSGEVSDLRSQLFKGGKSAPEALAAGGGPTNAAAASMNDGMEIDSDMMKRYLAIDPEGGKQIIDAVGSMDKNQRERTKHMNEQATKLLLSVESAPPEQRPMAYAQARGQAEQMGLPVQNAPPTYDPTWTRRQVMLGMGIDDILEQQKMTKSNTQVVMTPKGPRRVRIGDAVDKQLPLYEDQTALDQKISELVKSGVPDNIARGIAAGKYAVSRDPITGAAQIVDKSTGEITFGGPGQTPGQAPDQQGPQDTLWGILESNPDVTGMVTGAAEAAQGITGQFGANVIDEKLVEQRQTFRNAQNDLIRSLSINPRFPVTEMERIRKEVDITPGAATDPLSLRGRMRGVDSYLRGRLKREMQAAENPNLPAETRQSAASAAKDIRNFLSVMGVPDEGGAESAAPAGAVEFLRNNPDLAPQFDQKYGEGAAAEILGQR